MTEDKARFRKRVADAIRMQADRVEKGGLTNCRLECAIDELQTNIPMGLKPEELNDWIVNNPLAWSQTHIISIEIPYEAL